MTERALSIDDFFELTRLTDIAVSPDGERVAFTTREAAIEGDSFHTSLFVVPADGSREPHRLTRASDASSPVWSPEGTRLGFLASREEDIALGLESKSEDGEEDEESGTGLDSPTQVWSFDLARSGDARQLTDFDEGVRAFDWGPDGERIVVSARDPTDEEAATLRKRREENGPIEIERLQHKADGQGYLDSVTTYLFVVDADSRETRRLDDAYGRGAAASKGGLQPAWGPERIAFRSYRGSDPETTYVQDIHLVSPDGSDAECLTDGSLAVGGFQWHADGTKLAFVVDDPANVYKPTELFVADIDGSYRSVSSALDRTLSWVGTPEWVGDDTLIAPIGDEGWTRLARFHADGSKPERFFDAQGRYRTIERFGLAGGTVALGLSDPTVGIDVHAASIEGLSAKPTDAPTRLTRLNDDLLDGVSLPTCERVRFENDTGDVIEGFAYFPVEFDPSEAEARPLIASIHGGPTTYDEPKFDFKHAYWASQGYVVLTVNYRGSTSYGRTFSEAIRGDWGPRESDDILSGVEELVERGWADPDRLFLTGFSQGGINTAYVVARSDRFAAAAPEHGIYDFFSLYGTNDSHLWYENDVGLPWDVPERYRAMSSINDVDDIETPLLITAGEHDWRCPPTQAEQLYTSVRRRGIPSKLVVYQDEHHDVSRPKRAIHRLETITEWFEEHDPATDSNTNA